MDLPDERDYHARNDYYYDVIMPLSRDIDAYAARVYSELILTIDRHKERLYLERLLAQKARELEARYLGAQGSPYDIVQAAAKNALDDFAQSCLRLDPLGYFKDTIRLGIVDQHVTTPYHKKYLVIDTERQLPRGLVERQDALKRRENELWNEDIGGDVSRLIKLREEHRKISSELQRLTAENKRREYDTKCLINIFENPSIPSNTLIAFFYERNNKSQAIPTGRLITTIMPESKCTIYIPSIFYENYHMN